MLVRRVRRVIESDEITIDEARKYICEARMNVPGEIDAYTRHDGVYGNMLYRQYTLKNVTEEFDDEDAMLEYAREHMPEDLYLDLT